MSDTNTYTNWCNCNNSINAFRRDLFQGCQNHKTSLGVIEDRLMDIWPSGRDVEIVRAKINEVRQAIDAVWEECDKNATARAWDVFNSWEQTYNQEEQERIEEQKRKEQEERERQEEIKNRINQPWL